MQVMSRYEGVLLNYCGISADSLQAFNDGGLYTGFGYFLTIPLCLQCYLDLMSSFTSSSSRMKPPSASGYKDFMELTHIMIGGKVDISAEKKAVEVGKRKHWWFSPLVLLFWSALYEFMSFVSMTVVADFYLTVTSNDSSKFMYTLRKACVVIAIMSVCKSYQTFCRDKCALQWRENLVDYLHRRYFTHLDQSSFARSETTSIPEIITCNPEQRISQDVDKLTTEVAKIFDKLLISPVLILFYSYYLWSFLGWAAPSP